MAHVLNATANFKVTSINMAKQKDKRISHSLDTWLVWTFEQSLNSILIDRFQLQVNAASEVS